MRSKSKTAGVGRRMPARITKAYVLEAARGIASSIGKDPRAVIVSQYEPWGPHDHYVCEVINIGRGNAVRELGESEQEALERAYSALLETETSLRGETLRRGRQCAGDSSRGNVCDIPSIYTVSSDRKVRDRSPVRLGKASVEYPDAKFVYGTVSKSPTREYIERAFHKNGRQNRSAEWHLDVRAVGLRDADHYNLVGVRGETAAKRAAAGALRGYNKADVRSAYLSHVRADGAVIAQWRRVKGRWIANL